MNSFKDLIKKDFLNKLNITPHYQPIVDLSEGRPLGFEALSRFTIDGVQSPPPKVFQMAIDFEVVNELDITCREKAISQFPKELNGYLFLNFFPSYLTSDKFGRGVTLQLAQSYGLEPSRIVLELTEAERIKDTDVIRKAINHYKSLGFLVGIDDVGTGYNSLKILLELEGLLDFVKLPRELVDGVARSKIKYQLLKVLSEVSLNIGARPIYEGVEQEEDLKTIFHDLDGNYVQGFYFAKPMKAEDLREFRLNSNLRKKLDQDFFEGETLEVLRFEPLERFGKFLESVEGLSLRYFILDIGEERFLVDLWKLKHKFGQRERNLYYYRPVSEVVLKMENMFPRLHEIPQLTQEQLKTKHLFDIVTSPNHSVIILKNNSSLRLLEKHHIINRFYKKFSKEFLDKNPLTLLPGNNALQEKVKELSELGEEFYLCYVDLDNFKAFNDVYGFYMGDQMIKKVGLILSAFENRLGGKCSLFHIGGDDFVLILWGLSVDQIKDELMGLLSELQDGLLEFYSPEDRQRGYFVGKDRNDVVKEFPLASVSMALVKGSPDMVDVSKRSAQLKKKAKSYTGSVLVVETLNEILTINR
ncbi:MAG: GGDEF domain-containing protein [Aquificaceae bacterium]|nr:GGDEF domain-containing protein [Aquificaceae bacterium]